jgi:hypothetical protein
MQKSTKLLVLLSLWLPTCHKPTAPIKIKALPPVQRELLVVMKLASEQLAKAGPIAAETSDFFASARGVAEAMKKTRDLYAPEPAFYQLADEAFQYASESAKPGEPSLRALAWSNTQKACLRCHLRYGGPKQNINPETTP